MVNKMSSIPLPQNQSHQHPYHTQSTNTDNNQPLILQNPNETSSFTHVQNPIDPQNSISQQANQNQNIPQNSQQQNIVQKVKPSYRITSYPIQNKTYRLISLNDQDQSDQDSINQLNNINNLNPDDDFRQPIGAFLPPRFNPFSRWNPRNHLNQRRRFNINRRPYLGRHKKSSFQSILNYAKKVYMYIKSARLSSLYEYVPFLPNSPTLESKYKNVSLAILNNSINLQAAVIKALEYNIPLMQIIMNPKNLSQEQTVVNKILKDFTISHFINQNFVLYGDWNHYDQYKEVFVKNVMNSQNIHENRFEQGGNIVFRKGEIVFAEIELSYVQRIDHNQLQQKLQQIRNHYYREKQLYRNKDSMISQTNSNMQNSNSQQSSQANSNGPIPREPKTVKQIEEQILKDYLQQKMQQQIMENQQIYDEDDSDQQIDNHGDAEDDSSFHRSQLLQHRQGNQQHQDQKPDNDMIESRKIQNFSEVQKQEPQKPK